MKVVSDEPYIKKVEINRELGKYDVFLKFKLIISWHTDPRCSVPYICWCKQHKSSCDNSTI